MNKIQKIKTDGNDLIVIPADEYEALLDRLEELEDMQTVKEYLENPGEEAFPHEIVKRIHINNESPLRVFREYRGLSIKDLSDKSGVSSSYISNLEAGDRKGSYEYLKKLAEALNLDIEDIGG